MQKARLMVFGLLILVLCWACSENEDDPITDGDGLSGDSDQAIDGDGDSETDGDVEAEFLLAEEPGPYHVGGFRYTFTGAGTGSYAAGNGLVSYGSRRWGTVALSRCAALWNLPEGSRTRAGRPLPGDHFLSWPPGFRCAILFPDRAFGIATATSSPPAITWKTPRRPLKTSTWLKAPWIVRKMFRC